MTPRTAFVSTLLRLPFRPRARSATPLLRRLSTPHYTSRSLRVTPVAHAMPDAATAVEPATQSSEPKVKYLKDYKPPNYFITHTNLDFVLDDDGLDVVVKGTLRVHRAAADRCPMILDGEGLHMLENPSINGAPIDSSSFVHDEKVNTLTIEAAALPDGEFELVTKVRIRPAKNTALMGLYMSQGDYCTQCEAEGFRKITFYIDRPDVMAKFNVRVEADKTKFPILLSNGNCVEKGDLPDGKHWASFVDDFPKPCYLFALVAGDLANLNDKFVTVGGRSVDLNVFVKGESEVRKCHHAMQSLKRAMKWDEDTYGLEYNYDVFNIVAVPSFVFGAMENTSLNIFNSKYVLVSPETATDTDYNNVEGVVAHEYFHNYSGNRVTVNSWFQLSLKEGLTVFRDQSFSQDMFSATVKRIQDVDILRSSQFAEDAGPMAHPIRPKSYITCNSFYTATVYNKGAEVIRMLKTIVGPEGFRKGTDIYFSRNDGKAVTCDDWVQAIQDANPQVDLTTFRHWYNQSGTPTVTVDVAYDEEASTMTLSFFQAIKPTDKQPTTVPVLIPIKMGLIGPDGNSVPVDLGDGNPQPFTVINFEKETDSFILYNVPRGTVPSLLREFSAPVKLERKDEVSADELAFLMGNDTDEFNRWESGQKLALNFILECVKCDSDSLPDIPDTMVTAFRRTLTNTDIDAALRAEVFMLPSESYIIQQLDVADPVRIRAARKHVRRQLAEQLRAEFQQILDDGLADKGEYSIEAEAQGKRVLKNVSLGYLAALEESSFYALALDIVRNGGNMTDVLAALGTLSSSTAPEREIALSEFYEKWQSQTLVVDKWLRIQSMCTRDDVLDIVKDLTQHPSYKETVPNNVYALIAAYGAMNVHIPTDGSGYEFIGDQIIKLDGLNPQVAARVARSFTRWRKFDKTRQAQMEKQLRKIRAKEGLSKDVFEVVKNCLDQADSP